MKGRLQIFLIAKWRRHGTAYRRAKVKHARALGEVSELILKAWWKVESLIKKPRQKNKQTSRSVDYKGSYEVFMSRAGWFEHYKIKNN
jgi:hypothetical protein